MHLRSRSGHSVEEDQRNAEEVEEALVHQVLPIDELALPLGLVQNESHHDEASHQQKKDSEEGSLAHEVQDHDCIEDSSQQEGEWVHHCHVVRLVLLEAVEEGLVGQSWLDRFSKRVAESRLILYSHLSLELHRTLN